MFKQLAVVMLFFGVICSGILLGSRSGHATPRSEAAIQATVNAPQGTAALSELGSPSGTTSSALTDNPAQDTIEMATCNDDACDASCIARGFCEGGCRTTGKCTCLGHPPSCP